MFKLGKKLLIVLGAVFLLIAGLTVFVGYYAYQIFTPVDSQAQIQTIEISKGEGVHQISENLWYNNIIRDRFWFEVYVWQKGLGASLQAGKYELSGAMDIMEIAEILSGGKAVSPELEITIPEGWRLEKIVKRLEANGFAQADQLLSMNLAEVSQLDQLMLDSNFGSDPTATSLQGFLFPDTYRFFQDAAIDKIAQEMLFNFNRKLDVGLRTQIKEQGLTIYQAVTLASIVEKEVATQPDREIVAGIFYNRLQSGQALQSCATIAYALGQDKWRYSQADLGVDSLYNTYKYPGLPPGPIAAPGLSALRAVAYPQDTDYNYFLTDPETGQTIFAKTLDEHNANKVKYFK